jgi:hypothetical protein
MTYEEAGEIINQLDYYKNFTKDDLSIAIRTDSIKRTLGNVFEIKKMWRSEYFWQFWKIRKNGYVAYHIYSKGVNQISWNKYSTKRVLVGKNKNIHELLECLDVINNSFNPNTDITPVVETEKYYTIDHQDRPMFNYPVYNPFPVLTSLLSLQSTKCTI